jgi:hypothetical protein
MASVPYQYSCTVAAGFVMDPNAHQRYGFVTSLGMLGPSGSLARDQQVSVPFNSSAPTFADLQYKAGTSKTPMGSASVVGVIEKFSWNGGVGDPITLDFYVSQQNATKIKTSQQQVLTTTKISSLAWWIADYDQQVKQWFEQAFPQRGSISGIIKGGLNVDLAGMKTGGSVMVYKVSLTVAPAANMQYALQFANSSTQKVAKTWGLVVGTLAAPVS